MSFLAPPSDQTLALRTHGLARRFGQKWALRGVSLEVAPGEVVGVTGHNGSGKSTLLRVVCTALRPSAGEGWVFGRSLARQSQEVRAVTGFFAHAPGLYDDLTASENLRFAAKMLRTSESEVPNVLQRVGLWGDRNERVRGFSAGMQRRLALGRLMLSRPRLLLLDEPYNNFDPSGIALVNEVIREARETGGAALVVVHDRRQGADLLNRVVELRRGVVASDSKPVTSSEGLEEPAVQGGR